MFDPADNCYDFFFDIVEWLMDIKHIIINDIFKGTHKH